MQIRLPKYCEYILHTYVTFVLKGCINIDIWKYVCIFFNFQILQNLTSPEYAEKVRLSINDSTTYNDATHYGADFYTQSDHGTAHISVLAPNGDAVAVTSTLNH